MKIDIRSRLSPFSHLPGTECLVPLSHFVIKIYPALISIHSLKSNETEIIPLNISGPVKEFTVIQNLERGEVLVFGKTPSGLLRYTIRAAGERLQLIAKKPLQLPPADFIFENDIKDMISTSKERLHLGQHKDLDWELVKRRLDLREILPVWHRLGQLTNEEKFSKEASLLQDCHDAVAQRKKDLISVSFKNLFMAGFQGIMVPRKKDSDYQGFALPPTKKNDSLAILTEGAKLIRSLFISYEDGVVELLPALPSELVSGKLCNFETSFCTIDFEWSKRAPRRAVIKALQSGALTFKFPKSIQKARLRLNDNDKGVMVNSGCLLTIEQGTSYYFDQFAH